MKVKAKLVGGLNDGQIRELDEAYPQIEIGYRVLERDGKWRVTNKVTYRLNPESLGSEPLIYEMEV